jgi:hypothetical protein
MNSFYLINYLVICISEFAERFRINDKQAYQYLAQYGEISFLIEHYEIEHTLSLEDAIDDITLICHNNGGIHNAIADSDVNANGEI